jgi:NADPH:quinone reductase-like Zn-dependent oxidoreductase
MKAMVQRRYGQPDVLTLEDADPPAVDDGGILVRVKAASVNPYDWHHVTGTPYIVRASAGARAPKAAVPGMDVAGQVEAVGRDVTEFRPGDEVFGLRRGAFAEYVSGPAEAFVAKPANLTFEQAAAVPLAGLTALRGLRDSGRLRPGHRVLVNGASGGVGTFAVQLAKAFGAEVTGVCSPRNVDAVRALGADHVIDYTRHDFVASGKRYDLILDIAGNRSVADRRRALRPDGSLVVIGGPKHNRWTGPLGSLLIVLAAAPFGRQRMVGMLVTDDTARPAPCRKRRPDLVTLRDLHGAGAVTPVIERTYPLPDVPEALRYVGAGHARGKIVITV